MCITFPRVMFCLALTIAAVSPTPVTNATPVARNEPAERVPVTPVQVAPARAAVEAELVRLGVAPDEAKRRVATLSDEELATAAGQPAGGDSTIRWASAPRSSSRCS